MRTKLFIVLLIMMALSSYRLLAQGITNLVIIPTNPDETDSVKMIAYTEFDSGPCNMIGSTINVSGTTINVYVIHYVGILSIICHSIDTLALGVFNPGTYRVNYYLSIDYDTILDIDTVSFTVQQANSIEPLDFLKQEIKIYLTPSATDIIIDMNANSTGKCNIELYSLLGQKIKEIRTENKMTSIDISNLTEGAYLISITDEQGRRWKRKIIKNAP